MGKTRRAVCWGRQAVRFRSGTSAGTSCPPDNAPGAVSVQVRESCSVESPALPQRVTISTFDGGSPSRGNTSISPQVWKPGRPHTLVVACSDGRLQEATDAFLSHELGLAHFDRFYMPGGGGALASSGRDFIRAEQMRHECRYIVEIHEVSRIILLFHGPASNGPVDSICADYRRKFPWASAEVLHDQQRRDARDLIDRRTQWALGAEVMAYRCEVQASHEVRFVALHRERGRNE